MSFNLHPVMAAALVSVAPPDSQCHVLKAYHDLLFNMDWQYQFSDDHRIVQKGEEKVQLALLLQAEVDPTGELWRSYSGSRMHGAPQPIVREVEA